MIKPDAKNKTLDFGGFIEFLAVFSIFYFFAAWPVPDSNEPHYIGKAIHFWNPDWIPNDSFLDSKDSHWLFYVVFGWLSFFFSPPTMAWIGRLICWLLTAWSWKRLSFALIPCRWASILTALGIAYYVDAFHMAGEWLLGGVEGKSFAFAFVFFGLEAMLRGRWHRTWIFLGIASAFHVLVGGWSVLVAGFVWLMSDGARILTGEKKLSRSVHSLPWGLGFGGLISLFGLIPALMLDHGASDEVVRQAHQVYVFKRLYHHLVPYMLPWTYSTRFCLLVLFWFVCCRLPKNENRKFQRFNLFVLGTLLLSAIGFLAAFVLIDNQALAAEILRFYWFRLADVAVPMGVAIGATRRFIPLMKDLYAKAGREIFYPSFSLWLALLAFPFALYLYFDYLLFGRWFFSWTRAAEPAIPWLLTLLCCWFVVAWLRRYHANTANNRIGESLCFWGFFLIYFSVVCYAPFDSLKKLADLRTRFAYSRIETGHAWMTYHWIDACRWISDPDNTDVDAKFWVPREAATFKWHARRSDVGLWKDVPQDAASVVKWYETMKELFDCEHPEHRNRSLTVHLWWKTDDEIAALQRKYGFEYILCTAYPELPHLKTLHCVYENQYYRVYRVSLASEKGENTQSNQ